MICSVCGIEKQITEFPKNGTYKDGTTRYRTDCKVCYGITRKLTKKKAVTKFLNNTKHRTGEIKTYGLHDWKDVMIHFHGCCGYCGVRQSRKVKLTRDHVVPVTKGGLTVRNNIIGACSRCNSSKSNYDLEEWYPKQPFYSAERMQKINEWRNQKVCDVQTN
jgi:5-methylcytosine-specific restriction endonuclease McrA